ncbi:ankyrin repeat domain-containing protein SOWAHC-like [Micropterus salmoides]|uniref:ankyrin repeat domain-containing protein SOWAHC-like n=1 Tax=Micropterus salmoides TaxID=27706 RepID=UPI0018EDC737|nr:ankyrin repeat domain-containing protein SOWAHC-like [Micropterus salmoides]
MAAECTQEAILGFLKDKGGKVKNTDLIEHFKAVFPEEPEKRAAVRERFKNHVDDVAFVKTESGVKYVCLKKKFRCSVKGVSNGTDREPAHRYYPADSRRVSGNDAVADAAPQSPAGGDVQPQVTPASGLGSDKQVTFPHGLSPATILPDKTDDKSKSHKFVCVVEEVGSSSGEMGNRESFRKERKESKKERVGKGPDIPEIAVIEVSPLPAAGPVFTLPGPVQTGITGQVDAATSGLDPKDRQVETESQTVDGLKEAEQINVATRRRNTKGSKHRFRQQQPDEEKDERQLDERSLSGSEGNITPISSRKHFIKVMVSRSPQLRRSMVLRNSVHLSSRDDSDSVSLASSNQDDDRASVALDPLEHEWMVCASDGEWGSMYGLLTQEPSLVLRKDFVTGFTCLHWAAKHGKPELIALIINFAKQHNVPISVDVRSNTGYTPLHIAAMHNHMEVVKLLVGAYNTDVEIRDYSGRKACQYLTDNVSVDIRDIIGAYECSESENADPRDGGRWRFSKVLQSNLKPLRLLNPSNCDSVDGEPREKPLRRKSSLSRMKPKLQRLRARTSQIVHSTSFRDSEELDGSAKGSFKSRPKTHFFG